jgi:hypothetical protein
MRQRATIRAARCLVRAMEAQAVPSVCRRGSRQNVRSLLSAAAVLVVSAFIISAAPPTAIAATGPTVYATYHSSIENRGVYVIGSPSADALTLSLDTSSNSYVVSDPEGVMPAPPTPSISGPVCEADTATVVRCPNAGPIREGFPWPRRRLL